MLGPFKQGSSFGADQCHDSNYAFNLMPKRAQNLGAAVKAVKHSCLMKRE